jgi:single-strand DNA-binding protein
MNKLTIIGNLTRDPELRVTPNGVNVCDFSVAVNRRLTAQQKANGQQQEADFFRVTAWRELGENCSKYLAKGRKVAVIGPVSVRTYTGNDGVTRASLEVTADEVEFLTPRDQQGAPPETAQGYAAPAAAPAPAGQYAPQGYAPAPQQYAPAQQQYAPAPQYPQQTQMQYGAPPAQTPAAPAGFTAVETDDLPF